MAARRAGASSRRTKTTAPPAELPRARAVAKALGTLRAADPKLGRAIDVIGTFRLGDDLREPKSVYAALAQSIVSQQLSGRAAATIYGRVCALSPGSRNGPRPEEILAASDETLRGAGLSGAKARALRDLAEKSLAGEIPTLARARNMEDEALVERLTAVRGIGRWTVEMFMIFRLGRPDILPIDDYGVRKGFAITFGLRELPKPRELAAHGERWAPYRTVASWYLWRVADRGALEDA